MTAEAQLRRRLQGVASSMDVGGGALADVQSRASKLGRRRAVVRGSAGALSLAVLVLGGFAFYRTSTGPSDFSTVAAPSVETTLESAELQVASGEGEPPVLDSGEVVSGFGWGVVYGHTAEEVPPPADLVGADLRYSFSGDRALAHSGDDWFAYDGSNWNSVEIPEGVSVVAVDLFGAGRVGVLGSVQAGECAAEQVVGVRDSDGWRFVRVDDGTPGAVHSELVGGHLRVMDGDIRIERSEELSLRSECADDAPLSEADERLLAELALIESLPRQSQHSAVVEPLFETGWGSASMADWRLAATGPAQLEWYPMAPDSFGEGEDDRFVGATEGVHVVRHEADTDGMPTRVVVTDGVAHLHHGERSWEICHVPDVSTARAQIGWVDGHLAVTVYTHEPQLFLIERVA